MQLISYNDTPTITYSPSSFQYSSSCTFRMHSNVTVSSLHILPRVPTALIFNRNYTPPPPFFVDDLPPIPSRPACITPNSTHHGISTSKSTQYISKPIVPTVNLPDLTTNVLYPLHIRLPQPNRATTFLFLISAFARLHPYISLFIAQLVHNCRGSFFLWDPGILFAFYHVLTPSRCLTICQH